VEGGRVSPHTHLCKILEEVTEMGMARLAVFSLALATMLVAGGTPPPVEGVSRYPNLEAQQAWEQMGKRWEAAAQSIYGTLGNAATIGSRALPRALSRALSEGSLPRDERLQTLAATPPALSPDVVAKVAQARVASAKYVTNLGQAKADGYQIITPMIPNMGYHYMNPNIAGFSITRPPILVYARSGDAWQLVAVEWVFPKKPATAPLRGARYGSFGAACHYVDGSFVMAAAKAQCTKTNAKTGAAFSFWHPRLVTLHMWIWYPNPEGIFGEFNPYLTPFNSD
jgi:hypothetical protein